MLKDIEFDINIKDNKEKSTDGRKKKQKFKGLDLDSLDGILDKFR